MSRVVDQVWEHPRGSEFLTRGPVPADQVSEFRLASPYVQTPWGLVQADHRGVIRATGEVAAWLREQIEVGRLAEAPAAPPAELEGVAKVGVALLQTLRGGGEWDRDGESGREATYSDARDAVAVETAQAEPEETGAGEEETGAGEPAEPEQAEAEAEASKSGARRRRSGGSRK